MATDGQFELMVSMDWAAGTISWPRVCVQCTFTPGLSRSQTVAMITRNRPAKLVWVGAGLFLLASFAASALLYGVVAELLAG